ncbi:MAG: hypothetical protein AB7F43_07720 [Bacteriovoracia bacterium]
MKRTRTVFYIFIVFISSCSTSQYKFIEAERIETKVEDLENHQPKPQSIVEDAMVLQPFGILPNAIHSKIETIVNSSKDLKETLGIVQSTICSGKRPRFSPSYKVHFIVPKSPKDTPLDKASQIRKTLIEFAKYYLSERFFLDSTERDAVGDQNGVIQKLDYNKDFTAYKNYVLNQDNEPRSNTDFSVLIPFVEERESDIEKFYQTLEYAPSFSSLRWVEKKGDWHEKTQFLAIVFRKHRKVILVPKYAVALYGEWNQREESMSTTSITINNDMLENTGSNFYDKVFYIPSKYGWKQPDGKEKILFPLHLSYADDLELLKDYFTFVLPIDTVIKLADFDPNREPKFDYNMQYWGYDVHDSSPRFSAALALKNKDYIWQRVFSNQTLVKEAAQPDGSILFDISLKFDLFCAYAVPITTLKSQ